MKPDAAMQRGIGRRWALVGRGVLSWLQSGHLLSRARERQLWQKRWAQESTTCAHGAVAVGAHPCCSAPGRGARRGEGGTPANSACPCIYYTPGPDTTDTG